MATHRLGDLVELDLLEVRVDGALLVGADGGPQHLKANGLGQLHHAPLLVAEHQIDDREIVSQRGLELLDVEAHRAVTDDAHDLRVGFCDLPAERL